MSNRMLDVLCVGRACCMCLLVVLFRWVCVVPFGVVCVGRVFCWSCYFVERAALPLAWCVWNVFLVGRVVSLGVRRSAAFRLAWCVWGVCFCCWSCCFVGRAAFRLAWCVWGVAGRDSDEPRGPQDQVVDRTGLR